MMLTKTRIGSFFHWNDNNNNSLIHFCTARTLVTWNQYKRPIPRLSVNQGLVGHGTLGTWCHELNTITVNASKRFLTMFFTFITFFLYSNFSSSAISSKVAICSTVQRVVGFWWRVIYASPLAKTYLHGKTITSCATLVISGTGGA